MGIAYTECRDSDSYSDFAAAQGCDLDSGYCCYIAINTARSECCWYNDCPEGGWTTDISGTGFSCGDVSQDSIGSGEGQSYGSSTGWLKTEWPVEPGEEITVTFHIHDTADANYDSAVLIDRFLFVDRAVAGTDKL